ncbi:MAG TPA: hypothetical protein VHR47_06675 [Bacillota bacterium]|nr:hypothetical protein [Bacillota bacterium]
MYKRILIIVAIICLGAVTVCTGQGPSKTKGDYKAFSLKDSRKVTEEKYDALIKTGDIRVQDPGDDGSLHFTAQIIGEDFYGGLYFYKDQLYNIELCQSADFTEDQYDKELKSFIYDKLIPFFRDRYGDVSNKYDYPDIGDVNENLSVLEEWIIGKKDVSVCVTKGENGYYADILMEDLDLTQLKKVEDSKEDF